MIIYDKENKELWMDWKQHPCTCKFMARLEEDSKAALQSLLVSNGDRESQKLKGKILYINDTLNLSIE